MTVIGRTTRAGLMGGLIAYPSVALFYSAFDFLAARGTLYTVNLFGRSMFRGLRDAGALPLPVRVDPGRYSPTMPCTWWLRWPLG